MEKLWKTRRQEQMTRTLRSSLLVQTEMHNDSCISQTISHYSGERFLQPFSPPASFCQKFPLNRREGTCLTKRQAPKPLQPESRLKQGKRLAQAPEMPSEMGRRFLNHSLKPFSQTSPIVSTLQEYSVLTPSVGREGQIRSSIPGKGQRREEINNLHCSSAD